MVMMYNVIVFYHAHAFFYCHSIIIRLNKMDRYIVGDQISITPYPH